MSPRSRKILHSALKSSAAIGGAMLALSGTAFANPLGGTVTTGAASISNTSSATTVHQTSEGVVIDWSSFNVGSGQTTTFAQPNAQAIAVNRIGSNSASQILGTLDGNGRVVLINGNGLLFGKNSKVDVGSLIATSTDGADSDVLAGKFTKAGNQNAAIVNRGAIAAAGHGTVALVAPNVTNRGTVQAKLGTVSLGAANAFTVDFKGDGLVSFAAQGDVSGPAAVVNTGKLAGAAVSMTAHTAEDIATGVVNQRGVIKAEAAHQAGGTILLDAGEGSLKSTGTLNAGGKTGGGNIETSGAQVSVTGRVTAGTNGKWKVDPDNLTIDAAAAQTISRALNHNTGVWEVTSATTASGYGTTSPGNGDIIVDGRISWSTGAMIYLYSYHSLIFNTTMNVKNGGCLSFAINNADGSGGLNTGGVMSFANGGHIDIDTGGTSFTLNDTGYTVVDNISTLASDIASSPSGNYVLGLSYNATADGTYTSSPIATTFTGTFYGLGNTISHLNIDETSRSSAGLFADVGNGGLVSGLGVDADIASTMGLDTGALAGVLTESLYDDYSIGRVKGGSTGTFGGLVGLVDNGGSVNDSYSTARTTAGHYSEAGGLIGTYDSTAIAENDYASGSVTAGSSSGVGGLIGYAEGTGVVEYDFATGAVSGRNHSDVGGLIGEASNASLSQDYSTGLVSTGTGGTLGGLIGSQTGGTDSALYWDMTTSGVGATHGVGNVLSAAGVTGLTTTQFTSGLPNGFSASVWGESGSINGGLPYLLSNAPA